MSRYLTSFFLFLLIFVYAPASIAIDGASSYSAQVMQVSDGDTLVLNAPSGKVKARLAGIDAPEHDQPYGPAAQTALEALVSGQMVRVVPMDRDQYGRVVARIYVGDINVNVALVRGGYAWVYRQYTKDPALYAAELGARSARRGLWARRNPVPPWKWRAQARGYFR